MASFLLIHFLSYTFSPAISYALTSGPSQPEFSSFEPVSTTNMVDEFTGDFTYNLPIIEIPGPQGSSYPLSLSYHSGVTPEEESSWVGYGWTLNPGAINRSVRGLPDDFKGKNTLYNNKMPKNWTATVGGGFTFGELFSKDIKLGFNASLRYNNYRGFGYNAGAGLSLGKGVVSLGYNVSDGQGSFSLGVNPAPILNSYLDNHQLLQKKSKNLFLKYPFTQQINKLRAAGVSSLASTYGIFSYNETTKPTVINGYAGASFNVSFGITKNPGPVPIGAATNVFGSYSYQNNIPVETIPSYGYMYSGAAGSNSAMDYHVEKETDFNKRDVFLGMPFSDPDNFIVTGEGIGGGFKLNPKRIGHFGPRNVKNDMNIFNVGGDIGVGWTFGAGVDLGVGKNSMEVKDWNRGLTVFSKPEDTEDEPFHFRFNNDLGGEWGTNHNDQPVRASISGRTPSLPSGVSIMNKNGERGGRSSYIGFNTNTQMLATSGVAAYNKNSYVNSISGRVTADPDLVGELAVFNETGSRYVYALPVYNKNEKNLSFSVEGASVGDISNNFLIYNTQKDNIAKVGDEQSANYASTYLLTEITSPDYLDITSNGPTQDDFGGYTRFNYSRLTTPTDWYNWRMPYRGLIYNKNSHSDPKDDMGSYSEGEKEIYHVNTIETKTHVAFFYLLQKDDAKEAPSVNPLSPTATPGAVSLQKLDRIELYSLQDCNKDVSGNLVRDGVTGSPILTSGVKPVKTVYFKYDNSLCTGLPNSAGSVGKLTLKSVYFEYNGVARARLSPYQFTYSYPTYSSYPSKYTTGQENVTANYSTFGAADQNPNYNPFLSDSWGNYQTNGQARFASMQNWIDQKSQPGFDPAAWHLKVIKLPSGGEIHIQYEQDDYNYVQDQEAHLMMNISSIVSQRVFLDATSVGLTNAVSDVNLQVVRDLIRKRYVTGGKKMYFKILYSLIGNTSPDLATCNADFINGFASITSCDIDSGTGRLYVDLRSSDRLPIDVCKDFVKTQRLGMLDPQGNCTPGMNNKGDAAGDALSIVRQLLGMAKGIVAPGSLCGNYNPQYSFLRVPASLPKKGGGVRVKRLMTFDTTLGGEPVLFGNEYAYKTNENGREISSGVATNEPTTIREENVLTDFIARKGQNLWSKIVAGKDKKQSEGPLGESILPGPAVGYSKVTIKNIHSGKTNPGFTINEFFTAKDFPIMLAHPDRPGSMTPFADGTPEKKYLLGIFVNIIKDKTWVSQGFSFVLNGMHGQAKSKSTYNGPYSDAITLAKSTLVSQVSYEYYKPGEKVPMMSSLFGEFVMKNPGREVDLTFAQKQVVESSYDANIEGDLQIAIIPLIFFPLIIVYPTAMPALNFTEGALYTHATTKVVRYPSILKKTRVYQDGILHTEENLAFDEYTGKPIAVKSSDEFRGAYLAQGVPASWEYDNFKPKAQSEKKVLPASSNMTFTSSTGGVDGVISVSNAACDLMAQVTTGDVLALNGNYYYHIKSIDYTKDRLDVVAKGSPYLPGTASITSASIFASGRNNRLAENAGDVTLHNSTASNLTTTSISVPESQRWVTSTTGNNNNDGSLFIKDLNAAFVNPSLFPLQGPYYKMNVSQFAAYVPGGCGSELNDATIRNVQMLFKTENGSVTVAMGSFEILCGATWQTVVMP